MRVAVCALSAILLSGCSWLGSGHGNNSYGTAGGAYGAGCAPGGAYGGQAGYGYNGGGAGCAGGGYGLAGNGYGAGGAYGMNGAGAGYGAGGMAGYGAGGYGMGANGAYGMGANGAGAGYGMGANGAGVYGMNGAAGYGAAGTYGAGAATTLGGAAPYGAALGGAYGSNVVGTQMANGQYVQGAAVQTVQGAPVYVPQPYPAYYGVPQLRGVGAAMPFGIEAGIGTLLSDKSDFLTAKPGGFATDAAGNPITGPGARQLSPQEAVSYGDAFDYGVGYDLATTYDLSRDLTLLGRVGYNKAEGQTVTVGTASEGTVTDAPLDLTFSDMEQVTLEGGVRKYMGSGYGGAFRPYVGATAGFTHTSDVTGTYSSNAFNGGTGGSDPAINYVDGGWSPTASGVIGAEMAVGPRSAIGVETGIRWSDDLDTLTKSDDRISIPVSLRGRVSF